MDQKLQYVCRLIDLCRQSAPTRFFWPLPLKRGNLADTRHIYFFFFLSKRALYLEILLAKFQNLDFLKCYSR